ncbi:Inherit from bctoNOG: RHS repeat-associated core domain-containing protein [Seminavis robusta]|uniref:Inherit from bctoNOG: RHS repeat-associated core domain-containing protein n=1 Tax=Seminavis robusta TaxID=568900 RepID=A0A9N8DBU0_9STRA|nr:Inherit from bctoNOG: RHS repeat-associated core domain-containing protein [Seminavis robusta]|eukprot:Sro69_g038690.1 Inherit from bctoNOG: RHS repeat-associated core domain-containing protein (711) ;mRNA; f:117285-119580
MSNVYQRCDSNEWDPYYDFYEEEVLSEEEDVYIENGGVAEEALQSSGSGSQHGMSFSGHPFDESTRASQHPLPVEEQKTEIVLAPRQADPPQSARYDRLEPTGQLRRGARSSTAPLIVQRPVLLPQEVSSSTLMPQELSSSGTPKTHQSEQGSWSNDHRKGHADKRVVAVAPTLDSSVVDIEEDHLLPADQIVCYRGNALVAHKGHEIILYEPPKYLHEIDVKDSLSWRSKTCLLLLLFLLIALAVSAGVLYFVVFKEERPNNPTMAPTEVPPDSLTLSCPGQVTTLTDDDVARYGTLTAEQLVPSIYTTWNYSIDDCQPANQAAVWLSTGNGDEDETDWLQRFIMAFMYFATEGSQWPSQSNWLSHEESVCSWQGLGCTGDGAILKMNLAENSLTGPMISELGLLPKLQVISLQSNAISGSIDFVTSLPDLNLINLSNNRLVGPVPNISAPNLELLNLHGNVFTGIIPPSLGMAVSLKHLDLGNNCLQGTVPSEINNLSRLSSLNFEANNILSGRIATEFGRFADLKLFSISNTAIRARIPRQYGALTKLEELRMANTLVGGDIPAAVANMTSLRHMDLSGSRFRKEVPGFLGTLTKLTHLSLHNNSLTGEVPSELGALKNLTFLQLDSNSMVGTVPSEIGLLTALDALTLHGNDLITGRVPAEVCRLRELDLEIFTTSCPMRTEQGDQLGVTCAVPLCCSACIGRLGR